MFIRGKDISKTLCNVPADFGKINWVERNMSLLSLEGIMQCKFGTDLFLQ